LLKTFCTIPFVTKFQNFETTSLNTWYGLLAR